MPSTETFTMPPAGQRLNIGSHHLHVHQAGSGNPAVIFEAGLGSPLLMWGHIQEAVAKHTHTLSYDRTGMGWSDNTTTARTPQQVTDELDQLLAVAGLPAPYILVGHSFGGLIIRYFAQRFPEKVKALVLVDSSYERQFEALKGYPILQAFSTFSMRVSSWLARFDAISRSIGEKSVKEVEAFFPPEVLAQMVYCAGRPESLNALWRQSKGFRDYFGPHHIIPDQFGDLPLRVVTAAESVLHQPPLFGIDPVDINNFHLKNQERLAQMSTQGENIVIPKATHLSIVADPIHAQAVAEVILQLLD